ILNEKIRTKRGLINVGGKISKSLFGTLDSDDEELYKNYFTSIEKNENVLMRIREEIAMIVNKLKNKYIEKFHKLSDNLKLLQIVPSIQEIVQMRLLTFELKDIKNVLDEIKTAEIMHNNQIRENIIKTRDIIFGTALESITWLAKRRLLRNEIFCEACDIDMSFIKRSSIKNG
ncbi:hypothetical protein HHI36_001195, partial [Cryptolaemus montrouzieri]